MILAAVGKLDRLVACTRYCADVCPEVTARRVTVVNDSWTADTAQITAVRPDLVIAAVPYQEKAVTEILRSGTRFLGLAPRTLADIYTDISMIAGLMGAVDRGQQLVVNMQHEIETVRERTRGKARPRVFCEEWGKPLIRSQAWVAELVEAAGGEFLGDPGAQTSPEAVLAEDPDVVIAAWCGAGDRVPLRKLVTDRNWADLRAAKTDQIYCIRDEFLNTPAPTLLQGLHALAAALHPGDFPQAPGLRSITNVLVLGEEPVV